MDRLREDSQRFDACSLPQALEVMGERWSFLILRAAFSGVVHFEDFWSRLGIARNILANRLARLVDHGILIRLPSKQDRRRVEYHLTAKGADLLPAMLALRQWGEKYALGGPPDRVLVDRRDGRPIALVAIRAHDGRELGWHDLAWADRDPPAERTRELAASLPG